MNFDEYRQIEAVNWSRLKLLRQSPAHYRYAVEHPEDTGDTPGRRVLRAIHAAVLEPEDFDNQYAVWDGGRRAGKAYQAFKDEHEGLDILNLTEMAKIGAIAHAVKDHPIAGPLLGGPFGKSEITLQWRDESRGIDCKGRADRLIDRGDGRWALVDLKTVQTVNPAQLGATAAKLGWHGQLAFYGGGVRRCCDARYVDHLIVAVEDRAPHDVGVFSLDPDTALYAGEVLRDELLDRLAECRASDEWPGRLDEITDLPLPAWAYPRDDDGSW